MPKTINKGRQIKAAKITKTAPRAKAEKAAPRAKTVVPRPAITERQARILAAIVREYTDTAQPVGSLEIEQKYRLNVSPATIRNEMMALEKMAYIEQPHTSAGRVPTDLGFRYFINELMKRVELSVKEQKMLHAQLLSVQHQHQELGRNIAKLLAERSDQAAFALLPEDVSATGLSNILQQPNLDKHGMVEVAQFFDDIDEYAGQMLVKFFAEKPEALIGKEHSLKAMSNYSLIVSNVRLPSGKTGLIGIIGPKSMRYDKNMTLVEYVAKFLSAGALVLLFIKF